MKKIVLRILASTAILIGISTVVTGSRALTGSFDPGYTTFDVLISYNIFMGLLSILAGYLIWKYHRRAFYLTGIITIGHITVLLTLITIFMDNVAQQSVNAMIFRSILWIVIFIIVYIFNHSQKRMV